MGKIIFSILFCVVPMIANATDMCARDNVTVLAFDPQVGCVSRGNNKAEFSWWAQMSYGYVAGESTCLSQTEVNQKSFSPGLSGVDANGENRIFCYCRISHPVVSGWGQRYKHPDPTSCTNSCYNYCNSTSGGPSFCGSADYRKELFDSIGT
ncbi:MAG: hypothetical protein IKW67_00040 [Alphaproteobacteria bacterium]|nr:hypothetical protein [Alphaproteobacteria bacterium]